MEWEPDSTYQNEEDFLIPAEFMQLRGELPEDKIPSHKEVVYINHYLRLMNKTRAWQAATGSISKNAGVIAWSIHNRPHVKKIIESILTNNTMKRVESVKIASDMAQSNLNDYMIPRDYEYRPVIKKGYAQIIEELKEEILQDQMFLDRVGYTEDAFDSFMEMIADKQKRLIRYEIALERNPEAHEITRGAPEIHTEMIVDTVALASDKERGRIKKFEITKDGSIKIELHSALDAVKEMNKVNGAYEKNNDQKSAKDRIMQVEIVEPKQD